MTVDVQAVAAHLGARRSWRLVDARAPERYRGDTEPIDKVGGHIPGAANHFFQWNLDEQGLFRTPEELRAKIAASVGDVPADQIVCYCGSGVTACHNLLAFEHAGLTGREAVRGIVDRVVARSVTAGREGIGLPNYPITISSYVSYSCPRRQSSRARRSVFARHGLRDA